MKEPPRDAQGERLECADWFRECLRRARVLHLNDGTQDATEKLNSPAFAESVYITPYNKAVFFYGTKRARKFAEASKQQLF